MGNDDTLSLVGLFRELQSVKSTVGIMDAGQIAIQRELVTIRQDVNSKHVQNRDDISSFRGAMSTSIEAMNQKFEAMREGLLEIRSKDARLTLLATTFGGGLVAIILKVIEHWGK